MTPDYLRFDFPFDRGLTDDELRAIEDEVHRIIRDDRPVSVAFMSMAEAIEGGADAFFDEKYGETVRTVRVQDYSFELCGGTHCRASGQIGGFLITGERSIGSGMRRIEAVTGAAADALVRERFALLERAAAAVGAQTLDAVPDRIAALQDELQRGTPPAQGRWRGVGHPEARRACAPGRARLPRASGSSRRPSRTTRWTRSRARPATSARRFGSGVVALALDAAEPQLFVTVSEDLVARGISAGDLVNAAMPAIDGRGGGRPAMAQGRGTRREGLDAALAAIRARLETGA